MIPQAKLRELVEVRRAIAEANRRAKALVLELILAEARGEKPEPGPLGLVVNLTVRRGNPNWKLVKRVLGDAHAAALESAAGLTQYQSVRVTGAEKDEPEEPEE